MKIMITGGSGRLGPFLVKEFPACIAPSHKELDVTDLDSVSRFLNKEKPDVIIHAAAWTNVRACQSEHEKAWKNNVVGTENMVKAARPFNPYFVYVSTACVFDGERGNYSENDIPCPKNYYGITKLAAEEVVKTLENHLIIRTDFVKHTPWPYEGAFVDRFSTCIFADQLAPLIKKAILAREKGVLHITGKGKISHFDLARLTTQTVKPIYLKDVDVPLPRDQSLTSVRWPTVEIK
jgi:dTDP-4-dehydrorhamnose reductase